MVQLDIFCLFACMRVMQFYHLFSQSGVCEAPVSTLGGHPVPALLPALAVLSPARPGLREQSLGLGTVTEGSRGGVENAALSRPALRMGRAWAPRGLRAGSGRASVGVWRTLQEGRGENG